MVYILRIFFSNIDTILPHYLAHMACFQELNEGKEKIIVSHSS